LASESPWPTTEPWSPDAPTFSVTKPEPRNEEVRVQFKYPHMVVLGSHTQCGCGFLDEDEGPSDPRGETVRRLLAYLEEALLGSPELEIFACWGGASETHNPLNVCSSGPATSWQNDFQWGTTVV